MSTSLGEVLGQMQPGQTYRCQAQGRVFDLHLLPVPPELAPAPLVEADIMLDAWVELPEPTGGFAGVSRLGEPDPPDIPEIPQEETEL